MTTVVETVLTPSSLNAGYFNYKMQINSLSYVSVYIGSQAQQINMLLDTTSSVSFLLDRPSSG